jgi:hypothetical protein
MPDNCHTKEMVYAACVVIGAYEMDLWKARRKSLAAIRCNLKHENQTLLEALTLMDRCIELFHAADQSDGNDFALVCGQTLTKARRYAISCYSVCLNGCHSQPGALLRPLVEAAELLTFFHKEPARIELVSKERLPSAGQIAKAIQGELQFLRDSLNTCSSHFSLKLDLWQPIADNYSSESLKASLRNLTLFIMAAVREAIFCLEVINKRNEQLIDDVDACFEQWRTIFKIDEQFQSAIRAAELEEVEHA